MGRSSTKTYTLKIYLKPSESQARTLDSRLDKAIDIQNNMLHKAMKIVNQLLNIPEHRELRHLRKKLKKHKKKLVSGKARRMKEIETDYGYGKDLFQKMFQNMRHYHGDAIGGMMQQKLSDRVFMTMERVLDAEAFRVNYKEHGDDIYLEEKLARDTLRLKYEARKNKDGSIFEIPYLSWSGLKVEADLDKNDPYISESLCSRIKYLGIGRETIRKKKRFYFRFAFEGVSPNHRKYIGEDAPVGLDIGPSTISVCSPRFVGMFPLFPDSSIYDREIREISRYLDRSRRISNPENFNPDGTYKTFKERTPWKKSNGYLKAEARRIELYRKKKLMRQEYQDKLINFILSLGNRFIVEEMSWSGLARRAKKTTINEKTGLPNKKGRWGKSIGKHAPKGFLNRMDLKLQMVDNMLFYADTKKVKASQFNHITGKYEKLKNDPQKPFSGLEIRWRNIGGFIVQRDLYSAFLLMCVGASLDSVDVSLCNKYFEGFLKLHDAEIDRIRKLGNDSELAWYIHA